MGGKSVTFDYEDFESGGMTLHNPTGKSPLLPFNLYKLTPEFRQNQAPKPQLDSRNPHGTTAKRWDVQGGTCVEMRGTRSWFGQCVCGCWIYAERDASAPEFRGAGNRGPRGRWPKYCSGCRDRVAANRKQKHDDEARGRMRRKRIRQYEDRADTMEAEGYDTLPRQGVAATVNGQALPLGGESPTERSQRERWEREQEKDRELYAKWAQEDRESAARYEQRRGPRSPFN